MVAAMGDTPLFHRLMDRVYVAVVTSYVARVPLSHFL